MMTQELTSVDAEMARARRQRRVAELVAEGKSQRKIVDILEGEKLLNPETGRPYALSTINADYQELMAAWAEENADTIEGERRKAIRQCEAVYERAFSDGKWREALQALHEKSDLLGLRAPRKTVTEGHDVHEIIVRHVPWQELSSGEAPDDTVEGELVPDGPD